MIEAKAWREALHERRFRRSPVRHDDNRKYVWIDRKHGLTIHALLGSSNGSSYFCPGLIFGENAHFDKLGDVAQRGIR